MGLPYAVMSVVSPKSTTPVPNQPLLSVFADWQLTNLLAGPSHIITFWNDVTAHILIPIGLIFLAFFIAKPAMFVEIVERS